MLPHSGISQNPGGCGKTMEQCKEEARENTRVLSKELLENGEVSWTRVLDTAGHDELVYKLTLKYLRQQGYNIGNNKIPTHRSVWVQNE
jgi:hypothetical protein